VIERFTDNARAAIVSAREEACALGGSSIDAGHLLLGLCHEDARDAPVLAAEGLTAAGTRARLAALSGRGPAAPDGYLPFTERVKSVLFQAEREALGRQHPSISAAHLLLALMSLELKAGAAPPGSAQAPPDAVATLLSDQQVEAATLHNRAAAIAHTESAGQSFPFLGADLTAVARLPGRWQRWSRHATVLAGYAMLAVVAILPAPPDRRAIATWLAVIVPAAALILRRAVMRGLYRIRLAKPDAERIAVPGLRTALAAAGLLEVTVICVPRGRLTGRSAAVSRRDGRDGMIFLRPEMKRAHPDLTRFLMAHEAAHLARDDTSTLNVAVTCLVGLGIVAEVTSLVNLWLLAPALLGFVALRWRSELACDRLALRAAGWLPGDQFLAYRARADAAWRRRPRPERLRAQVKAMLSHPPTSVRRDAMARATEKIQPVPGTPGDQQASGQPTGPG